MKMNLCSEEAAGAIRQALDWIRANGTPGKRRPDFSYARIARAAFEEIRELAAAGFSYAAICEAFETNGLLPEGSRPYSLSRAVRREWIRRQEHAKPAETERLVGKPAGKKLDAALPNPPKAEPVKPDFGTPRTSLTEKEKEKERVKALTGSAEETALGKITKHSDGSFDFDWKN
jgi:hypothetical protein